jgi:hypothetical protein
MDRPSDDDWHTRADRVPILGDPFALALTVPLALRAGQPAGGGGLYIGQQTDVSQ